MLELTPIKRLQCLAFVCLGLVMVLNNWFEILILVSHLGYKTTERDWKAEESSWETIWRTQQVPTKYSGQYLIGGRSVVWA